MVNWISSDVAVWLMLAGIPPSLLNVYLLYEDWHKPGVLWFLVSMGAGGVWAFLFAMMTLIPSPEVTLFLANFFWAIVPIAAISMFLLAYEFVFKQVVSRRFTAALFLPVGLLFLLTWINPSNLVFSTGYYVDSNGFLQFRLFDGIVRLLVVQVYGYLLVFLAAGMFVGETLRSTGIQRRQAAYLLVVFSVLVGSTVIKVAGFVPIYYDLTSTMYAFSGLFFAYSINRHGLMEIVSVAREQTFEEVSDSIFVVNPNGKVVDVNRAGTQLFGTAIVGTSVEELFSDIPDVNDVEFEKLVQLDIDGKQRHFRIHSTLISYGRGPKAQLIVLSDITDLKERERELNLLKEIFSRVFRHNIRNDLTVIKGYAELIRKQHDGQVVELAKGIDEKSNHLVNQSEKVRKIEQIITQDRTITGPIREAVEKAIATADVPDNAVVRSSVGDETVEFHPKFKLAVQELIENAITHHDGAESPEIDIYSEATGNWVTLFVQDSGPGIPQSEIDVLRAGEETSLEHGSGIGLWLVRWIVIRSNGELIVESIDSGTRIGIRLRAAESETAQRANSTP